MTQECEQDHGREQIGQVLLAMPEVVLEVIALGLEGVVVLVLDLPSGTACRCEIGDAVAGDGMGSGPGIVEQHFAILGRGDEFAPVDHQDIVAVAQGHLIDIAVSVGEMLLADAAHAGEAGVAGEVGDPFVQGGMGVWLAGEDEVGMVFKYLLTERLMAVQVVAQESDAPCRVMRTPLKNPAPACGQFTILLGMAILRLDKLGGPGQ